MRNRAIVLLEDRYAKGNMHIDLWNKVDSIRAVRVGDKPEFLMLTTYSDDLNKLEEATWVATSYYPVTYPYQTIWFNDEAKWEYSYIFDDEWMFIAKDEFVNSRYSEHPWLSYKTLHYPYMYFNAIPIHHIHTLK